jgi:ubiquinone/menaquinone biosynthesis C-methylase UbiE
MDALFDKFSADYDDWYNTPVGKFIDTLETESLYSLLNLRDRQKVLDVCCGTGNFSVKLAKIGCEVTGLDISEKMIEIAESKNKKGNFNITLLRGDCSTISLRNNYYDAVISMAGFEFVENPGAAYKNLMKYLKPGGQFIIGAIQKGSEWQKLYSSSQGTVYEYAKFLSFEDIKNIDAAAFSDKRECLFIPPLLAETEYNKENELKFKEKNAIGGFICVEFKKPE